MTVSCLQNMSDCSCKSSETPHESVISLVIVNRRERFSQSNLNCQSPKSSSDGSLPC